MIVIVTPEGVRFGLRLAGPLTRFLAWMIDALLIGAALAVANQVLSVIALVNRDWYLAIITLAYFALSVGYAMAFEWFWGGQTPGKRMFRLRVVDVRGLKLQPGQVVLRNLIRFVDSLPLLYLMGGVVMVLSRNSQRLGDMAAGTAVVRQREIALVDPSQLALGKFNSLLAYPHLAARLRQKASPELVETAIQAVLRREEFLPENRLRLFEELAARLRALVEFPEDVNLALTSEQYVRGALEVIVSARKSG